MDLPTPAKRVALQIPVPRILVVHLAPGPAATDHQVVVAASNAIVAPPKVAVAKGWAQQ